MSNTSSLIEIFQATYRFNKIGSYVLSPSQTVERTSLVTLSRRLPLVYAIFSDDTCRYIGKTIQGYGRPLNYHKNDVMTDVRDGILHDLMSGKEVTVYARSENLVVAHEGFQINVIEGIEQALIQEYKPAWNNFVHQAA
jgi:hypothetical protein